MIAENVSREKSDRILKQPVKPLDVPANHPCRSLLEPPGSVVQSGSAFQEDVRVDIAPVIGEPAFLLWHSKADQHNVRRSSINSVDYFLGFLSLLAKKAVLHSSG